MFVCRYWCCYIWILYAAVLCCVEWIYVFSRCIHSTRIFLILLKFNMFVIADVWKCARVCVRVFACVRVFLIFWLCYSNGFWAKMNRKKWMYCKHCALESMENLSCKVKPTQFVYRIPKRCLDQALHFKMFASQSPLHFYEHNYFSTFWIPKFLWFE